MRRWKRLWHFCNNFSGAGQGAWKIEGLAGGGDIFLREKNSLLSDTFSCQRKYPRLRPITLWCGPPFEVSLRAGLTFPVLFQ